MGSLKEIEQGNLNEKTSELCENEFEHCFALLSRLIACKSYSGNEEECAGVLMTYFKNKNIPAIKDTRGSILAISLPTGLGYEDFPTSIFEQKAWLKGLLSVCADKNLGILAYNAHMDVVEADNPEKWTTDPFKASRRDKKIFGRGTCDMKGALAAMATSLTLMRELDKDFARKRLVIGCFCTEEEAGEGLAFKELCEEFRLRPSMVLLGEPSQMQIARGQRGKLEFYAETHGKCAHTSVPEAGENAAYKMARVLTAIESLDEEERFKYGLSDENTMKRSTIVATSLQSWPSSRSFVPNKARIHVTARTALGCSFSDLKSRLEASDDWPGAVLTPIIYNGCSYTGKTSEWPSDHPAWETSVEHGFFKLLSGAYEEILEHSTESKIWPFSTDGVYSSGMAGIPTLGLGPGNENCAHIVDEWVSEDQLKDALKIYAYLGFFEA